MNRLEQQACNELVKRQLISQETLEEAVAGADKDKASIFQYLQENKYVSPEKLLSLICELTEVPFVNLKDMVIEERAISAVPVRVAWHYEFMPISLENNRLTIAVSMPLSIRAQDEIRLSLGYDINMVLAKREQILDLLKTNYGIAADTVDKMMGDGKGLRSEEMVSLYSGVEDIDKIAEDASVTRLVNQIILEAYKKRATDIHFEPYRGKLILRYRIDGRLLDQFVSEDLSRFISPILSRIKIMANLNIVERRIPQDGRAIVKIQGQMLDLRVSFMPTPHGESVVIRILPSKVQWALDNLGLLPEDVKSLEQLLTNTSGIIFVTGPTGSGKTTTLYACIEKINTRDRKILAIEDPIEYEIKDTVQIQVNPEVGLTFAKGLRSMLRHDPDVMMVGEVRDKETAEIAIRVALTGHLVLSTLHTNDSASGITRLIDIGIKPYLIASTVKAFLAQRLVRVICPKCKIEDSNIGDDVRKGIAGKLGISPEEVRIHKGEGCEHCNFTGFYGRTAIYEILTVDDEIQGMIAEARSAFDIKKTAISKSMRTLLYDGWQKVANGLTTPEEVLKVCQDVNLAYEDTTSTNGENNSLNDQGSSQKSPVSFFLNSIEKTNSPENKLR